MEFPKRFNIHLQFSQSSLVEIIETNRKLNHLCSSFILFEHGSPHIPHITLLMGDLFSFNSLNQVCQSLKEFAKNTNKFSFSIENYKLMQPDNKYLFAFPEPITKIFEIKDKLFDKVGKHFNLDQYGKKNTIPHLTLAYFEENNDILANTFPLNQINGEINKVAIAEAGRKGTCINVIEEFELNGKK